MSSDKNTYLRVEQNFREMALSGKRRWEDGAKALQAIIDQKGAPRPATPGSELSLTPEICLEFYRSFGSLPNLRMEDLGPQPEGIEGLWTLAMPQAWTYDAIADAIEASKVPLWYAGLPSFIRESIYEVRDTRRAKDGPYTIQTPVGVNAQEVNPSLIKLSYRQCWGREDVLTAREAITLSLMIWWKHQIWLNSRTWTRTSSRAIDGNGVGVYGLDSKLRVTRCSPGYSGGYGAARSAILVA